MFGIITTRDKLNIANNTIKIQMDYIEELNEQLNDKCIEIAELENLLGMIEDISSKKSLEIEKQDKYINYLKRYKRKYDRDMKQKQRLRKKINSKIDNKDDYSI